MSLSNALHSILINDNFCFLCYRNVGDHTLVSVDDEVNVELFKCVENIALSNILLCVLGTEIVDAISAFTTLCTDCTKSAISTYIFIKNSLEKVKYLKSALDGLTNIIEYIGEEKNFKSLYVALNLNDFTTKIYYDSIGNVSTPKDALKQFQALDNLKLKPKLQQKYKRLRKLKSLYGKHSIKLVDILADMNNGEYKCKVCSKKHTSLKNLRYHFIRVHSAKDYKCDQCCRAYATQAFLDVHKTESHCKVICSQCGKNFNNRHTLKQHEFGHHFIIVCTDCGRSYKNQTTYKNHKELNVCGQKVRASPSNAKYTCDYCNKKYTQKVSLRVHIQYEHGNYKPHVCEWCGKKFWAKSRLNAHIVKHTKERNFNCELCNGKFVTRESLLYHTRRHTGERPYECPYCDSKFLSASRKSDHIKRAHKNSKFECNICSSKFGTMFYLQKHIKRHNSETNFVIPNQTSYIIPNYKFSNS
ncbi:hypothetical protein K1T71_013924 [Dendrolimus kikuchii]|uniref:Uncharacterized protein n=1 Tax=Dendrolimus kikuchii TaxID=765133 RepID=A0ACC1CG44_9NEOP|nr:hypothetical protein K1T71_013924 [Dendrolimus kikuchii]